MNELRKISSIVLAVVTGILISLVLLLQTMEYGITDYDYYYDEFLALNIAEVIGVEDYDMAKISSELVKFLDNGSGDLRVTASVNGEVRQVFNEKEITHLEDIEVLIKNGRKILNYVMVSIVIATIILFITRYRRSNIKILLRSVWITSIFVMIFFGSLYFVDFNAAFIKFHEIFFTNDLWMLDPRTDILIMMMPLEFFMKFVVKWLALFSFINVIIFTVSEVYNRKMKKSTERKWNA